MPQIVIAVTTTPMRMRVAIFTIASLVIWRKANEFKKHLQRSLKIHSERLAIQNAAQKFALHGDQYAIRALRT